MGIKIGTNFDYKGKLPNFSRDQFTTLKEMLDMPDYHMDEGHRSYCIETDKVYIFKTSNEIDPVFGKWREDKGETGCVIQDDKVNQLDGWSSHKIKSELDKKAGKDAVATLNTKATILERDKADKETADELRAKAADLYKTKATYKYVGGLMKNLHKEVNELSNQKEDKKHAYETYVSKIDFNADDYIQKTDIASVYRYMGSVDEYRNLPPLPPDSKNEALTILEYNTFGTVYSVKNRRGMNYAAVRVYVNPDPGEPYYTWKWDSLGGEVDLSPYSLTKDVDSKIEAVDNKISTARRDIDKINTSLVDNADKKYVADQIAAIDYSPYATDAHLAEGLNKLTPEATATTLAEMRKNYYDKTYVDARFALKTQPINIDDTKTERATAWSGIKIEQRIRELTNPMPFIHIHAFNAAIKASDKRAKDYLNAKIKEVIGGADSDTDSLGELVAKIQKEGTKAFIDALNKKLDKTATAVNSLLFAGHKYTDLLTNESLEPYYTGQKIDNELKRYAKLAFTEEAHLFGVENSGMPGSVNNCYSAKWCYSDNTKKAAIITGGKPSDFKRRHNITIELVEFETKTRYELDSAGYEDEYAFGIVNHNGRIIISSEKAKLYEFHKETNKVTKLPFSLEEKPTAVLASYNDKLYGLYGNFLHEFDLEKNTVTKLSDTEIVIGDWNDVHPCLYGSNLIIPYTWYKGPIATYSGDKRGEQHRHATKINLNDNGIAVFEVVPMHVYYGNGSDEGIVGTSGSMFFTSVDGQTLYFFSSSIRRGYDAYRKSNVQVSKLFVLAEDPKLHLDMHYILLRSKNDGLNGISRKVLDYSVPYKSSSIVLRNAGNLHTQPHLIQAHATIIPHGEHAYIMGGYIKIFAALPEYQKRINIKGLKLNCKHDLFIRGHRALHTNNIDYLKRSLLSDRNHTNFLNNVALVVGPEYQMVGDEPTVRLVKDRLNNVSPGDVVDFDNPFNSFVQAKAEYYIEGEGWVSLIPHVVNEGGTNYTYGLEATYLKKGNKVVVRAGADGIHYNTTVFGASKSTSDNDWNKSRKVRVWVVLPNAEEPKSIIQYDTPIKSGTIKESTEIAKAGKYILNHTKPINLTIKQGVEEVWLFDTNKLCGKFNVTLNTAEGLTMENGDSELINDISGSVIHLLLVGSKWRVNVR